MTKDENVLLQIMAQAPHREVVRIACEIAFAGERKDELYARARRRWAQALMRRAKEKAK